MMRQAQRSHRHPRRQGVALVIVLACIVLLSGLVVAYLTRSTASRQLSHSSFNQSKADDLARSALDIITSTLKQEIADSNGAGIPTHNAQLSGTTAIPNLIRISTTGTIAAPGMDYPASNASSTAPSANGRSTSPAQWNKHYLIPRDPAKYSSSPGTEGTDPIPGFTAPSWIYLTNQGPTVLTAPSRNVIGRYAYALYNEGGLLDVNVAGYPAFTGTDNNPETHAHMGSLVLADLTVLKLSATTAVNNIVGWRNYASAKPEGTLTGNFKFGSNLDEATSAVLSGSLNGFLKVSGASWNGRTDQAFLTRQELLAFGRATTGSIIPQDFLQYLGTFSRSFRPVLASGPFTIVSGSAVDEANLFYQTKYDQYDSQIVAGQLHLVSASPIILQTVIIGALKDASIAASAPFTSGSSNSRALSVILSGSSLATGAGFVSSVWSAIDTVMTGTSSTLNEACGEATLRALFSVRNTRTWNLMVDVVAQTGIFPPNAPSTVNALNSSFIVQGERHYWLHIAIDRDPATGVVRVLDRQLEPVYE